MATMSVASCNDGKAGHSIERAARAEAMNGRAFKLVKAGRRQSLRTAGVAPSAAARKNVLRRAEFSGARRRDDPRRHVACGRAEIHWREIDHAALSLPEGAELPCRRL